MTVQALPDRVALCEWLEPSLRQHPGQDPLALQTITTDRLLPALLPGVLALSQRARYFSIYPFLVRRYTEERGTASNQGLDQFIRRREFELTVAANLCDRCDADSAIGNLKVRPAVAARPAQYERTESITTALGGYGLYYRSPLSDLGIIVRAGDARLDEQVLPVDVVTDAPQAEKLADAFEQAISDSLWYQDWMTGIDPIPAEVLEELAEVACLCRLDQSEAERRAIEETMLTPVRDEYAHATEQRRRAFALLLEQVSTDPDAAYETAAFRSGLIAEFGRLRNFSGARPHAYGQWAAMAMREGFQEAICSIWHHFCRVGLQRQLFDGLSRAELQSVVTGDLFGAQTLELADSDLEFSPDSDARSALKAAIEPTSGWTWEDIVAWTRKQDDAKSGLLALLLLIERLPGLKDASAWSAVAAVNGSHQPGLALTASYVRSELAGGPTLGQLMEWTVETFVISPHGLVAASKLPDSTYRFWWEHGRMRFVDNGVGRFDASGLRRGALSSIAYDLGWWEEEDAVARVASLGQKVIAGAFGQ